MEHTLALIQAAHAGDKEARDTLVEENTGLVWSVVRRFLHRGVEKEDLFQIGSIGLLKAIDRFDPAFQVQFSTYAVPMITGELRRYFRDEGMLKVSRSLKERNWKILQTMEELQHERGRDVTVREVAERMGLTSEEIVLAMEANAEVESLNRPVGSTEGKEQYLEDCITDLTDEKEQIDNRILLEQIFSRLDEREQKLIRMRYFQNCTQTRVAQALHLSQVQVSRLEKKLLHKMREAIQ